MKAHEEPHVKHLARNSAKVLRWGATRSGRTTLAVRATTLPCPPWPIGRRQISDATERKSWMEVLQSKTYEEGYRIPMNFEANWMIVNSGDHPLRIRTWSWPWHVRSPPGALGWKGGWPLEDWAGGPRRRGVERFSLRFPCGSPKTWNKNLRFAGRDVRIFWVIFLLSCFFSIVFFFQFFEGTSEHLQTSRSRLVFAPSLQVLQIFVTFQKVVKLQLSKAEMSKMDSLWEITDMNRSYQHSTYATYHLSVRTCAGLYTRYGS